MARLEQSQNRKPHNGLESENEIELNHETFINFENFNILKKH